MPESTREITRDDLISDEEFAKIRKEKRLSLLPRKKLRRVEIGPHCTFYFENYDTMWFQIQEMLLIEKGGEEQIADELSAYNPLIPQGDELVATVMFEIEDEKRRLAILRKLGGIEKHLFMQIEGKKIYCQPEEDVERTTEDGKTSSVHFIRFKLSDSQQAAFEAGDQVLIGADHENYGHIAILAASTIEELQLDF